MVYEPGLEPKPGPGLWQAFNSGLAQDFESPSPPKPGPIHHLTSHGVTLSDGLFASLYTWQSFKGIWNIYRA